MYTWIHIFLLRNIPTICLEQFILIEVFNQVWASNVNIWLHQSVHSFHSADLLAPSEGGGRLRGPGSAADQQEVVALADLPDAGCADVPGGPAGGLRRPRGGAERTLPAAPQGPAEPM